MVNYKKDVKDIKHVLNFLFCKIRTLAVVVLWYLLLRYCLCFGRYLHSTYQNKNITTIKYKVSIEKLYKSTEVALIVKTHSTNWTQLTSAVIDAIVL